MIPDLRSEIEAILMAAADLTLATIRPDGWPQATVVSFVPDGLCPACVIAAESQKARNLARDDRVSFTVTPPYRSWDTIRGLSGAGRARRVEGADARRRIAASMARRFPGMGDALPDGWELADDIVFLSVRPEVFSVLDYTKGFGHADLVIDVADSDLQPSSPDVVEEADLESFPASDPPAWTGTHLR